MKTKTLIVAALILVTVMVYFQTAWHSFSGPDITDYITQNRHVISGLNLESVTWAMTTSHAANWHPLTWLSHMIDCQFFGLNPAGPHLVNVALHVANTILLFQLLCLMTGALWRSAFVAALFALHPLHVESVAWCAERKDVLSTLFWMLTMISYTVYVRTAKIRFYMLSLCSFALGLMAKPMLVTLPCVLLMLDYWPLGRFRSAQGRADGLSRNEQGIDVSTSSLLRNNSFLRLLLEKTPFLALTICSSIMTIYAQKQGGAIAPLSYIPLVLRIKNILISYVSYLRKMIWPSDLAVFYSSTSIPLSNALTAAFILIGISAIVLLRMRRSPYLVVGWFWYLGTLVPVIGILQVGGQSMADRYTYIPLIGLFIMIAWGFAEAGAVLPRLRIALITLSGGILVSLSIASWIQIGYWKDNVRLYSHAIEVTKENYAAYVSLGNVLIGQGKIDQAIDCYLKSIKIKMNLMGLHSLGNAYFLQGKFDQAISYYFYALTLSQDYPDTHYMYGRTLLKLGRVPEAIDQFHLAINIKPASAEYHNSLGDALILQHKFDEANYHFSEAVRLNPRMEQAP